MVEATGVDTARSGHSLRNPRAYAGREGTPELTNPQISDYALLSDCQGAALVSRGGSIDWWCAPRFDSPSSFGRLLDPAAGHWQLCPDEPYTVDREYGDGTMVLETTFSTGGGRVRLVDALALAPGARGHQIGRESPHTIVRVTTAIEGDVTMRMEFAPRFEYGLVIPEFVEHEGCVATVGGADSLTLRTCTPLRIDLDRVTATFRLREGESACFSVQHQQGSRVNTDEVVEAATALEETMAGWCSWTDQHPRYVGRWSDHVRRSALVLQALTYQPSGAIVAAPTTSLPEVVGGAANWDYRFAWLRDASMTLEALWIAACPDEAARNFEWMARAAVGAGRAGGVQIVFGVEGERDLTEHVLPHLRGHQDSRPVRVGNDAWRQTQLDVFGEVLASAHLLRDQLGDMAPATLTFLADLADVAAERWREPDSGIWEGREGLRDYLSSKLMCWVALDRAFSMADLLGVDPDRSRWWEAQRDIIRATILKDGWSEEVGAYTGAFGSDHLDASVLLMSIVGFHDADDERMRATVEVIDRELTRDGLVRRWTGAEDGAFFICSFWLADCLAREGRLDRAVEVFESAIGCANDVGLLSEEVDLERRQLIGNFPQALSHVGVINAAASIDAACQRAEREVPTHTYASQRSD
jgi:GH15 family glucan-1,4-alpha-glucosidase